MSLRPVQSPSRSDIPKHYRIINKGSSEGFSPWFLLLGATSSAAGMLNMYEIPCSSGSSGTNLSLSLKVDTSVGHSSMLQKAGAITLKLSG